jgi:transposase-like protein
MKLAERKRCRKCKKFLTKDDNISKNGYICTTCRKEYIREYNRKRAAMLKKGMRF